jgi:isoamylase
MNDQIQSGIAEHAGAVCIDGGINFALYSAGASAVELCLFDADRNEVARHFLPEKTDEMWHGFLPGCTPGQRYGYRVHGDWSPQEGLRFNPAKLLIDPYARQLDGVFNWSPAVFDFQPDQVEDVWLKNEMDSSASIPLGVVVGPSASPVLSRPHIPWSEAIIYETNVSGFTMRHPDVPQSDRGRFRGMSNGNVIQYIKSLGITSVELMPVHTCVDEAFLIARGLRNFWGYNSIHFFVPDNRFAVRDGVSEFREMVNVIHDAGIEVILDVVYNHTGESDERGPTLSFRGIDNLSYYRSHADNHGRLINDTGCGNTINADEPVVQQLILDSLSYWHSEMGVDGFRFDLASVLGRTQQGFDSNHPLLQAISQQPGTRHAKLIAEPWDTGLNGYQLGGFPAPWAEWNDRYRDSARRFWRGDPNCLGDFARSIHGSSDLFEAQGRPPAASINFICSHDGFTLSDLVSFEQKHNQANGQNNADGHEHNFSCNHGLEGHSDNDVIRQKRLRHRLNLLTTLLISQGTPMILSGDEFGNSQNGNNNAYAQDNDTSWLDWRQLETNAGFFAKARQLIRLRNELPLLRQPHYLHGKKAGSADAAEIQWIRADGEQMLTDDWSHRNELILLLCAQSPHPDNSNNRPALAILVNNKAARELFTLPELLEQGVWEVRFHSSDSAPVTNHAGQWRIEGNTIVVLAIN